jgi:hypothetical protein
MQTFRSKAIQNMNYGANLNVANARRTSIGGLRGLTRAEAMTVVTAHPKVRILSQLLVVFLAAESFTQHPQMMNGTEYSTSELIAAAKNSSSFDRGLTAEWLLAIRTQQEQSETIRVFKEAVFARTNTAMPEWWCGRLTTYMKGLAPVPKKTSFSTELKLSRRIVQLGSEMVLLPRSFQDCHEVFGSEFGDIRVITAVSKQQELLPLLIIPKGVGQQGSTEAPLKTWNPALARKEPSGFPVGSLPDPAVEFFRSGKKLVVFIDLGYLPSLSVFDYETGRCDLSFVAIRSNEAAFLNWKAEDLRPGDGG